MTSNSRPQLPVASLDTGSYLPGRRVTTAEVVAEIGRAGKEHHYEARTGIRARHWAAPGERLVPMCAVAIRQALATADLTRSLMMLGHPVSRDLAEAADVVYAPNLSPYRLIDWDKAELIFQRAQEQLEPILELAAHRYASL